MIWCDFCRSVHEDVGYDVDARPPHTLDDVKNGLEHASAHGIVSAVSHRCADQYLVYALILVAKKSTLDESERETLLHIAAHYQHFNKTYE